MVHDRTSKSIQAYNVFKLVVTLILILIIIILLLSARRGTAPPQVVEPTVAAQPTSAPQLTATPQPAEPAIAMPVLAVPQVGDDGTVTLSGTGPAGSTVEVWASGERIGRVTVGADGRWSFVASLDAGDYDFTARAVDAAGATLVESTPFRFTVPALVEAPTLTTPRAGDSVTGGTLELEGTGQPGAEIEILDNGQVVGTAVVQADGTWAFDYKCDPGAHAITVQNAGDAASVSDAVSIEVAVASTPVPAVGMCSEGDIPMGIDQGMTYVVAQCEYMGLIAERTGVTLADLIAANPQVTNPNLIYSGQVLNLPPR